MTKKKAGTKKTATKPAATKPAAKKKASSTKAAPAAKKKAKRVRVLPEVGQVFAAPLLDGRYGLIHVCFVKPFSRTTRSVTAGFFPLVARSTDELWKLVQQTDLAEPFAVITISSVVLVDGMWPLLGEKQANYTNVDVASHISGQMGWFDNQEHDPAGFMDMYHGTYPWDGFYDPEYLDKLLLPGQSRPRAARMKKDFTAAQLEELGV
jgi:hypothetical protein